MNPTNYLRDFRKSRGLPDGYEWACGAPKFSLPDEAAFQEMAGAEVRGVPRDADLRIPFPKVVLEVPGSRGLRLVILAWETEKTIRVASTLFVNGGWEKMAFCGALLQKDWAHEDGSLRKLVWEDHPHQMFAQWCIEAVAALCSLLACSNVHVEQLPANPKLAKAAAKRGALPFDTYHVLTVGAASSGAQRLGQSEGRSPREHLRRGHIRRLDDGRRLWINATVVNPGVGGTVSKAYAVR